MGLLAELGVKPADVHIDDIDKNLGKFDIPAEGVHHAILDSCGPIPNADGRGWKLVFKIIAGPSKDLTVEEALWRPKGSDPKKDKTTQNKVLLFAHRLGLLRKVKGPNGQEETQEVEGKHDFSDCLGVPCFIDVFHEEEEYEKDGKKKKIMKAKLQFKGLLAPDDKKVIEAKVPTASSAAVSQAAAPKPKDNFDNL